MNVILSGAIGAGKSTAVREAIRLLKPERIGGVVTGRANPGDPDSPLVLWGWDGKGMTFARARKGCACGLAHYEVDIEVFNAFGAQLIEQSADASLVVLDELGILEKEATRYVESVVRLWQRHQRVLAVVQRRAMRFWMERLACETPYVSFELDARNRGTMPESICNAMA